MNLFSNFAKKVTNQFYSIYETLNKLLFFKGDGNKLIVHELNATQKIFALTNHEERVIQRNATMALGVLSSNCNIF